MAESPPIIYVVDDDRDVLKAIERLLESAGYEVATGTRLVAWCWTSHCRD